jgi:hypothetical protein
MHPIVLHGAVGIWDEVACLAIPATVILGVTLAVLREKPQPGEPPVVGAVDAPVNEEPAASERGMHGEQP